MTAAIRRGTARFVDRASGRVTHHGFSFGSHYDAEHTSFGPMVCHDDHLVGSGKGFETHRHTGLDIVTYVVAGTLEHRDSTGGRVLVPAGSVAVLRAGSGVEHAETASPDGPCRFVQVWLTSAEGDGTGEDPAGEPSYSVMTAPVTAPVVVGDATLEVVRLQAGQTYAVPPGPRVHGFVATGALVRFSLAEPLAAGDAFLFTDEPSHEITAAVATVLLVWRF